MVDGSFVAAEPAVFFPGMLLFVPVLVVGLSAFAGLIRFIGYRQALRHTEAWPGVRVASLKVGASVGHASSRKRAERLDIAADRLVLTTVTYMPWTVRQEGQALRIRRGIITMGVELGTMQGRRVVCWPARRDLDILLRSLLDRGWAITGPLPRNFARTRPDPDDVWDEPAASS